MAAENFIQGNTPEQFCEMLIEWSSQGSSQPDPLQSDLPGSGYPAPGSMLAPHCKMTSSATRALQPSRPKSVIRCA